VWCLRVSGTSEPSQTRSADGLVVLRRIESEVP
jgi:hypothetical protein